MRQGIRIIRKRMSGGRWTGVLALLCLLLSSWAEAGVPVISRQRVSDVTPRSFSVIFTVNEPSASILSLFTADCATPFIGAASAIQQNQVSGNTRITISGLNAATGYCYQLAVTSASTSELTTSAATQIATAVAIERTVAKGADIVPSGNDILKVPAVHLPSGETRDSIIATVELLDGTAVAPLSLLLGSTQNRDYFNLNNLFSSATGKTYHLTGGERIKVSENHGATGCVIERFRTLPKASGGTAPRAFVQANAKDIDASGGVNILDVLRVVGGKGTASTGPCFNSDLDLNGDGIVDSADLSIIKGGFNGLP